MAVQKPSIPKGTRDFLPTEMARRNYIFDTIREVFRCYGFQPIETPAMENLSTLLGKYGEEGDKLLFRILNSGNFLEGVSSQDLDAGNLPALSARMCEKGLRYDLTVPFARFVVQNQSQLVFPFRRYQIQPVWRADRPQKGRYREFFQCDADVVGSDSLLHEADLIQMVEQVFSRLGIRVVVKINNRKILSGVASLIGAPERVTDITVAIDKLDKICLEQVNAELRERGLPDAAVVALQPVLALSGSNQEKLACLDALFEHIPDGREGVRELREIFDYLATMQVEVPVELDLTLARGLNYYTGAILEVKALDVAMGSICGGGRYDNLTGIFGLPGISGVGISFGADRIFDVLTQLDAFPRETAQSTRIMFVNFGAEEQRQVLPLLSALRRSGISAELYPEASKIKKQLSYADARHIPLVAMIGADEAASGTVTLKDMQTGTQQSVPVSGLCGLLAAMER